MDLRAPALFINRELSLMEFNRRVLAQARDPGVPLLERLRFLCIVSSNLDEFFEIRVAGLKQQVVYGAVQRGPDGLPPTEQLARIAVESHALVEEQYRILNEEILPALAREGIRFLKRTEWDARQSGWVRSFFDRELYPVLSPIGLDPAHPFPRILNKSLNFLVSLEGRDAFGRDSRIAIVQAPRALPRVISIPERHTDGPNDFVLLSGIIHAHVGDLFPGMRVTGCYQFRVTRDSDLFVDEEEIDDLKRALEGELSSRRFGDAVRMEVADGCPPEMIEFLLGQFKLGAEDLYQCNGPVNLMRMMAIPDLVERPDLKYPAFTPALPARLERKPDVFEAIRQGDLLLHHPYESFSPVIEFVRQAAADPQVLAIRQTFYRTGSDSALVKALIDAARSGKEVLVVIELMARFDEEANIDIAEELQEAGAHVVYGVVGHKTHAKMCLVVRREGRQLRRYVHLGTGNYHARTARLYTDMGLFTCDPDFGEDVHKVFQQLTALGRAGRLGKLLQAPFTLHKGILDLIRRETRHAAEGRGGRIVAKMNALIDPLVVEALYEASRAGVSIDLVVRGVCALRPGLPGISENIRVRSVIGRFLEHERVFLFGDGGAESVWLSSADWMGRNFFDRVEVCFPIEDPRIKAREIDEALKRYLDDTAQAWLLQSDGSYLRAGAPEGEEPRGAQAGL
ncbi:MAG: polyphosphate kinase 1, partial [Gammaproteobacteria bacterium]